MDNQIIAACIEAAGTAFAGGAAAYAIMHRKDVITLAKEVAAYHSMEGKLIEKLIEEGGGESDENVIQAQRGILRKKLVPENRPSMTAAQAKRLRAKYLSFD